MRETNPTRTKSKNILTTLVLTVALLCSVVGLGLYSVLATENGGYKAWELEVRQDTDRQWYAFQKGTNTKATKYYGVVPNDYGWWRIEAGKVNFKASGVYYNDYGYWYIQNGKVNFDFNGVLELDNVVNQKTGSSVYTDAQGNQLANPKGKTSYWYFEDGKILLNYSGAKSVAINGRSGWWRISGGRVQTSYTGVASNEYGWWYFKNGRVDFSKTGVERNDYGWWRIENGKVNFNYNGVASNDYGSWYIVNGKVDFSFTGAILIDETMYVIENGRVVETSTIQVGELPVLRPTVVYTNNGAELSWTAPTISKNMSIDGYEIYVKNSPTDSYTKVGSIDAKTTTFKHNLGWSYSDPDATTRLYDVRAVTKNYYGIVTSSSPERKANAANNYVGGAFELAEPDIVSVEEGAATYKVTFKNVPYATQYDIYIGSKKVASANATNTGAGTAVDAQKGFVSSNQTVTIPKTYNAQSLTVQAVTSEKSSSGYSAITLKSGYDTGFQLGQNQLKGQKILFLGDSLIISTPYGPTTMDYAISTRVAQQTGASVYNAAVGGATLVSDYPRLINNSIYHNQNLLIANGTHEKFTDGSWTDVSNLTDFDIVVLEGGPNDFYGRVKLGTLNSTDKAQFYGALNQHLKLIKEASQKRLAAGKSRTKVVLVDIFYAPDGDSSNLAGLKYADYKKALKAVADAYASDPDIDLYWYTGTDSIINNSNYKYRTVDNVHMTAFYYGQIGNHMATFLKSLQAKDHSGTTVESNTSVARVASAAPTATTTTAVSTVSTTAAQSTVPATETTTQNETN